MQHTAQRPGLPSVPPTGGSRSQSIIITAITLFALSGLLVGFAYGALTIKRSTPPPTVSSNKPSSSPIASQHTSPTATQVLQNVALGCPQMGQSSSAYMGVTHVPDGTTPYTLSVQATDKTKGTCGNSAPIQISGITCKVWLVKRIPKDKLFNIPGDYLIHTDQFTTSAAGKVGDKDYPEISGLVFDPTTPQTQQCSAQGQANWKYTVSPNLEDGNYDLIVLTDYQGKAFNWSWFDITVQKNQ